MTFGVRRATSLRLQASRLHICARIWRCSCGLPTGAFSSVFPTPLPHSLFLHEINTHTPQSSCVWPLSRLVNYFPPLQGSWIGERMGLCSFSHGEKPSTGPVFRNITALPPPSPSEPGTQTRTPQVCAQPRGFSGWPVESLENRWPGPKVALSPAHYWVEVRQSLMSDLMGCGFTHRRAPQGPGTLHSKEK